MVKRKNVSNGYDKATMTEHKQDRYDREQLDDSISEKLNEIFEDLDGTTKH